MKKKERYGRHASKKGTGLRKRSYLMLEEVDRKCFTSRELELEREIIKRRIGKDEEINAVDQF